MKNNKGKFIIVEGIDGTGKTSTIKEVIKNSKRFRYSKGFTFTSKWDNFVHARPNSMLYYTYLLTKTKYNIKPLLNKDLIVLQDRYIQSVDSFMPDCKRLHNRTIRKILSPLFLNPALYIYLTADIEVCINRLKREGNDKYHENYHLELINNVKKLTNRKKEYDKIFDSLQYPKVVIDTTNKNIGDCAQLIIKSIKKYAS